MAIKDGQVGDADDVMGAFSLLFKNNAQVIWNEAYEQASDTAWNSKLHGDGAPQFTNLFFDTLQTDSADVNLGFDYDASNDKYTAPDIGAFYVIVEADDGAAPVWTSYDTNVLKVGTGTYLVYCDTGTDEVRRAQVHKSLWLGAGGLILDFTNVTAVKSSDARDTSKKGYYASMAFTVGADNTARYTGTFADAVSNTDCSVWSDCTANNTGGGGNVTGQFEFAAGTVVNSAGAGGGASDTSNEIGTDTSADEKDNQTDVELQCSSTGGVSGTAGSIAIILAYGAVSWVETDPGSRATCADVDFFTTHSIPAMTLAGAISAECTFELIFKDTAAASTTNTTTTWNQDIDVANTLTVSISYNGGGSYETITDGTIQRNAVAGTAIWLKFSLSRADNTVTDDIFEWATVYNWY